MGKGEKKRCWKTMYMLLNYSYSLGGDSFLLINRAKAPEFREICYRKEYVCPTYAILSIIYTLNENTNLLYTNH